MGFSFKWPVEQQKSWNENQLLRYLKQYIFPYHPFYRKKYKDFGIAPSDLRCAADVRRLPLVTKQDMLEDHLAFVLQPRFPGREPLYDTAPISKSKLLQYAWRGFLERVPPASTAERASLHGRIAQAARFEWFPMHFHASGGTTGNPSPALYSHYDIMNVIQNQIIQVRWCGISEEDRGLNLFPAAPHLAFFQVVFSQILIGGSVFHTCGGSVMPTERQIQLCEKAKFDYVVAIPSYLTYWLEVAGKMRKRGEITSLESIRRAVVAAEPMVPAYRERIKNQFASVGASNVQIIEGYGMTEIKGSFYGCAEGSDIHLCPVNFFWEVLDPVTHEPVPEGQPGVLTFSHIGFRGTVFIRYYTGDLIRGLVWDKCPNCGRIGPRLLTPLCRAVKDFTKIKGSRVNLLNLQTAIRSTEGVESFHVVITKERSDDPFSRDWVRVHVAKKQDADENAIIASMKKNVKLDCEISPSEIVFNTLDEVEQMLFKRTGLKADWISDERQLHV